ncbi:hypothetical protein BpHYR1_011339, partial [Brachionus plicatilis]
HYTKILGGGWGYANERNRDLGGYLLKVITNKWIASHYNSEGFNSKGLDQFLLEDFFYKHSKKNSTTHDSYLCQVFGGDPWPTKREKGCFFGCIECCKKNETVLPCPIECRPKNHQDWIYC